jgi:hypothetical protein
MNAAGQLASKRQGNGDTESNQRFRKRNRTQKGSMSFVAAARAFCTSHFAYEVFVINKVQDQQPIGGSLFTSWRSCGIFRVPRWNVGATCGIPGLMLRRRQMASHELAAAFRVLRTFRDA